MPKMVKVVPNPDFKPSTPEEKKVFQGLKPHTVSYIQARENMRAFRGMLIAEIDDPREPEPGYVPLEKRPIEELKVMMASLGVRTEKKMSKAEVITVIRAKLDDIEVTDD